MSMHVKELTSGDQRTEGPGVYLLPAQFQFGMKPMMSPDNRELVPFYWATEFPPLGEFIGRFPTYWKGQPQGEYWLGGPYNPEGIYWCRYDPKQLVKATGE